MVLNALEQSRHATSAALYLLDKLGTAFDLASSFGAEIPSASSSPPRGRCSIRPSKGPVVLDKWRAR